MAEGLSKLSAGESYGLVSKWALRQIGNRATGRAGKASRNHWGIASGWVEAFSPIVWKHIDGLLRARALERLEDSSVAEPAVIVIDDVPVTALNPLSGRRQQEGGFYVLVLAEVHWQTTADADSPELMPVAETKLRLVRAMPRANKQAWRLCFAELGYDPDVVVTDTASGALAAIRTHFPQTAIIPSIFHVGQALEHLFWKGTRGRKTAPAGAALPPAVSGLLSQLASRSTTLTNPAALGSWWDTLEATYARFGVPVDKTVATRRLYETPIAAAIPHIVAYPSVPISTGGLETIIRTRIGPALKNRAHAFGNLERTNRLFDLVVARDHDLFDDVSDVARLLRADAITNGGVAHTLKQIDDPQYTKHLYKSLRDPTLIEDIAREAGF